MAVVGLPEASQIDSGRRALRSAVDARYFTSVLVLVLLGLCGWLVAGIREDQKEERAAFASERQAFSGALDRNTRALELLAARLK